MSEHKRVFLIGAHKAGTTSLAEWLDQSPLISVASSKEPGFFCAGSTLDLESYASEFDTSRPILIDASTNYSIRGVHAGVAGRIHAFAPDARVVYVTRDPLSRIVSAWRQHVDESAYAISHDLFEAVAEDAALVNATMYHAQLSEYRRFFPDEQLFTCPMEILLVDRTIQRRLLHFIDDRIPAAEMPSIGRANQGIGKQMDRKMVAKLLHSARGASLADALRSTPLRPALAKARRAYLMKAAPQEESSLGWTNLPEAESVARDCFAYLAAQGLPSTVWPSLNEHTMEQR